MDEPNHPGRTGPAIEFRDVRKTFGSKVVLDGLDLAIRPGESLVVIGGSGTGKSVLIKNLIGLLRPDSGEIAIDGQVVTGLDAAGWREVRRRFGMLFQGAALFDSMSVVQNVAFPLAARGGLSRAEIQEKAAEKLALVGMTDYADRAPASLSGGMKKRVGLARALAMEPDIMLYDEPTTGLDPIMGGMIDRLIVRMNKKFLVTSITITHDMRSAYRIADRIAMLYKGKIAEIGTPEEIRASANPVVSAFVRGASAGERRPEGGKGGCRGGPHES